MKMKKIIMLCIIAIFTLNICNAAKLDNSNKNQQDIDIVNDNIVCCYGYKYDTNMIRVNEMYRWRLKNNCIDVDSINSDVTGIVDDVKCDEMKITDVITGLSNAVIRVNTQERAQHLGQVMSMIQEQRMQTLQKLEGLEVLEDVKGEINAKGKKQAKLLYLIKAKHMYKYKILDDGTMIRVKRFVDIFWKDIDDMK